jgi:hypothetical protein
MKGGEFDAKYTHRDADGLGLWPLQHARLASGSGERLGDRLGSRRNLTD